MVFADSVHSVSFKILFLAVLKTGIYSGPIFKKGIQCVKLGMLNGHYVGELVSLLGSPGYQEGCLHFLPPVGSLGFSKQPVMFVLT